MTNGQNCMARVEVSIKDRERFARARAAGRQSAHDKSAVIDAQYDSARDVIEIRFRSHGAITIPRKLIPELQNAPPSSLRAISVSPAGDAISWRSLDIDVYVPGLLEHAFGSRVLAAATGRRGGQRRTKRKAAAAKANGAKGGRPRTKVSAERRARRDDGHSGRKPSDAGRARDR
jgi:hypothetical protein